MVRRVDVDALRMPTDKELVSFFGRGASHAARVLQSDACRDSRGWPTYLH